MNIHARRYNNNESGIFEEEIEEGEFVDEGEQDRESSSTIFSPATNGDITMNVLKSTNGKVKNRKIVVTDVSILVHKEKTYDYLHDCRMV